MQRYYKLRPSRFLALLVSFLCAVSLVSLWLLPLPVFMLLVLTLAVLCWGGYSLLLDANLRMGHSCVAFRLENREEIVLVLRSGSHLSGRVSPDSFVTPNLVILNVMLSEQGRGRSLLIMPDTMGAESFRHLRVGLRWGDKSTQPAI
jgi:toxin CptA